MNKTFLTLLTAVVILAAGVRATAQETIVSGKVTDATSGEAIPYARVFFKGTSIATSTDFDGNYRLKTDVSVDSIGVMYVSYVTRMKALRPGMTQVINFQLLENNFMLKELVIVPGENPALRIMKKVLENKSKNDPDQLTAFECESFNRIEISIDNISEEIKSRKIFKSIKELMDSVIKLSGEDGKPILPVFVSETLSDFYYTKTPHRVKEKIKATKLTGVGIEDGSLISQLLGSTFQQYNFYENWNRILDKDFVSPIANSGNAYYIYTLRDTVWIDDHFCYEIQVNPKRKQDLAFTGTIWIADTSFALKRVVLEVGKGANLNFIQQIKIQQELMPTGMGPWIQSKARILVDVEQLTSKTAGMIAKFYTSNKNYTLNKEHPPKFYEQKIEVAEDAQMYDTEFWEKSRHDSLTAEEKYVYSMVDSVKKVPALRTIADLADLAVNGYYSIGQVDVGPYIYLLGYNRVEGYRFRFGGKTNADFSRKYVLKGYVAYGERDNKFKYSAQAEYIISRRPWTKMVIYRKEDIVPMGISDKPDASSDNLFNAVSTITNLKRFGWYDDNRVWLERTLNKNFSQKLILQNTSFSPKGDFPFAYYQNPGTPLLTDIAQRYTLNYATLETRFAYNETFLQNDNERISLGVDKGPEVTVAYSYGPKTLGSDFEFNRLQLDIEQDMNLGVLGNANYSFHAGYYFSRLPYPALEIHRGNQSFVYNNATFNLMNFFEFVSDHYASFTYEHYFEGLITNRLPLVRRLKLRTFANTRMLFGGVRAENMALHPAIVPGYPAEPAFYTLSSGVPYWEAGYGIENLFHFIRIDFIHRLTYLGNPGARAFGAKVSLQFKL